MPKNPANKSYACETCGVMLLARHIRAVSIVMDATDESPGGPDDISWTWDICAECANTVKQFLESDFAVRGPGGGAYDQEKVGGTG